jgi:hypothetical protein
VRTVARVMHVLRVRVLRRLFLLNLRLFLSQLRFSLWHDGLLSFLGALRASPCQTATKSKWQVEVVVKHRNQKRHTLSYVAAGQGGF